MAHLTMFVIFYVDMIICQNFNLPHIYHILAGKNHFLKWKFSNYPSVVHIMSNNMVQYTTRNSIICNHTLCNWDATACRMQLFLQLCPLFGCVCNYGATMITFIPTFGWFLWYIIVYIWYTIVYIWYAYTHSCMCNQNRPTMVFW